MVSFCHLFTKQYQQHKDLHTSDMSKKHQGRVLFIPYLQLPNKEGTGNASMITMKI